MVNNFAKKIHKNAKEHGWWTSERSFGDLITLYHTELSEAYEEYRNNKDIAETYYDGEKPCGVPSELADVIIRILDICEYYSIDIDKILLEKHEFNKSRPYKHGGKLT